MHQGDKYLAEKKGYPALPMLQFFFFEQLCSGYERTSIMRCMNCLKTSAEGAPVQEGDWFKLSREYLCSNCAEELHTSYPEYFTNCKQVTGIGLLTEVVANQKVAMLVKAVNDVYKGTTKCGSGTLKLEDGNTPSIDRLHLIKIVADYLT